MYLPKAKGITTEEEKFRLTEILDKSERHFLDGLVGNFLKNGDGNLRAKWHLLREATLYDAQTFKELFSFYERSINSYTSQESRYKLEIIRNRVDERLEQFNI